MPPRYRTLLLWGLFLLAAGVAGIAVHRLHRTAQQEISGQARRAEDQAAEKARELIGRSTAEARLAIITELAGFHEDGLTTSLQRWDAANEAVTGTFVWDAEHGFGAEAVNPRLDHAHLPRLWQEFREWRAVHPTNLTRETVRSGDYFVQASRTVDNPAVPVAPLRYQAENLDLATDAGLLVDPWTGWAARAGTQGADWIFWYQVGPGSPVRGCVVDVSFLVARLREELAGGDLVNVALTPQGGDFAHAMLLPGYRLDVGPGAIFKQKAVEAALTAWAVAILLGLFLLGAAGLGIRTWREARDAGRKITFVTQVSHELRTPLTSIRMFADLLAAPGLAEEKRLKFAGMIGAESGRLSALIERLLAFNALEQAGRPVPCGPLAVDELVREVMEEMKPTLAAAGLRPALALPAAPLFALGDHSTLKQALLNLVDNACKYARDSGPLTIAVTRSGRQVVLSVSDRGPGIPAEVRARLFEPFVQGDATLTTKSAGVGLGLSLARGLLRQTGAALQLLPGETGATFEIRLPAAPANPT